MWKALGVDVEKTAEDNPPGIDWMTGAPLTYDLSHTDEVFMLNKSGNERFLIDGAPNTQGVAPPPILDKFLSATGPRQPRPPRRLNLDSRPTRQAPWPGCSANTSRRRKAPRRVPACGRPRSRPQLTTFENGRLRTTARWPDAKTVQHDKARFALRTSPKHKTWW